jgi:hypothetical protein
MRRSEGRKDDGQVGADYRDEVLHGGRSDRRISVMYPRSKF